MTIKFAIKTSVSGGVTGPRSGWMKDLHGRVLHIESRELAEEWIAKFDAGRTAAARGRFHQSYEIVPVDVPDVIESELDEEDDQ